MTPWTDLFLAMPLPENWQNGLLFLTFGLHLLFVLLMLGTAMLGLVLFIRQWMRGDSESQLWNGKVIRSHLGLKSLAVVLGVAPLLIIQVRYSHAFFTATGLFSYAWLGIIPLLIVAFLLIDGLAHQIETRAWLAFIFGVAGVGALLAVPAVFTGVLSLMEREELWPRFAAEGFALPADYLVNWLLRYLHILGAALVFGAAFHLFFSTRDRPDKIPTLRAWLFGALLAQVIIGVPLLISVAPGLNRLVLVAVTVGAAAAMTILWTMRSAAGVPGAAGPRSLPVLLPIILVSMLVARQVLQDRELAPGHAAAAAARKERAVSLAPYQKQALESFTIKLATVYDNGDAIYDGACQPCHGGMGMGDGPASDGLLIPAEDIFSVRADRDYIYHILLDGVPGSGMPYFRLYDRNKLESLLDTLSERMDMFAATPKPAREPDAAARRAWAEVCATCHGSLGEVSEFGRTLLPPPPDLRAYSLLPDRALDVIADGYPGTAMQPFRALPEDLRRDLAALSAAFRSES